MDTDIIYLSILVQIQASACGGAVRGPVPPGGYRYYLSIYLSWFRSQLVPVTELSEDQFLLVNTALSPEDAAKKYQGTADNELDPKK